MTVRKLSAKTVSDIYLSTVRSVFAWAHENEILTDNVAEKVRQRKPKKEDGREKGYTDAEAVLVLRASRSHVPKPNQFGFVRETPHMTAAKQWAPIHAAFTGARISEITQLRKEDVRKESGRWIVRITPDAGSVKSGGFRDVPLHRQVIALGFDAFVESAQPGPLFHGSGDPEKFATAAQSVSDELAKWLRGMNLVPEGVRPNYGWRHRLKTQGLELGLTMRVIDSMQGHSGRTAGENYGDVTLVAKARVIDALPDYDLG
jgi:integrase